MPLRYEASAFAEQCAEVLEMLPRSFTSRGRHINARLCEHALMLRTEVSYKMLPATKDQGGHSMTGHPYADIGSTMGAHSRTRHEPNHSVIYHLLPQNMLEIIP